MVKVAIIGGGAAGLACATKLNGNVDTYIFESLDSCGKKILASGNGRCNISNLVMDSSYYNQTHPLIEKVIDQFNVLDYFNDLGLELVKQGNLIYPFSNQAKTVQKVLLHHCKQCQFIYKRVTKIEMKDNQYVVSYDDQKMVFDYVVVAVGSSASNIARGGSYDLLKNLKIDITDLYPSLVQFETVQVYKKLQGVRVKANVYLCVNGKRMHIKQGEVQFTNYGLSGICIMQLSRYYSRYLGQSLCIEIDVLPSVENVDTFIKQRKSLFGSFYLDGLLNDKLVEVVVENDLDVRCIAFDIKGLKDETMAQVISGGVRLEQMSMEFELNALPNLFVVGEVLDVDGDCGGYNLHFAFGSGSIVGEVIERRVVCYK